MKNSTKFGIKQNLAELLLVLVALVTFCIPTSMVLINEGLHTIGQLAFPIICLLVNVLFYVPYVERNREKIYDYTKNSIHCVKTGKNAKADNKTKVLAKALARILALIPEDLICFIVSILMYYMHFAINGNQYHVRGFALFVATIFGSYSIARHAFFEDEKYRKRNFVLYNSFLLVGLPFVCSIYYIDMIHNSLTFVPLPLIAFVAVGLFAISMKINFFDNSKTHTISVVLLIAMCVSLYLFLGTTANSIIRVNFNFFVFSLSVSVYSGLLLLNFFSNAFIIESPETRHTIEKFQWFMFNFAPILSITWILGIIKNRFIAFSLIGINLIAIQCVGKLGIYKIAPNGLLERITTKLDITVADLIRAIISALLLIYFYVIAAYSMFVYSDYNTVFLSSWNVVSIILAIITFLISNINNEKVINIKSKLIKKCSFIGDKLAYYTTKTISSIIILCISNIFEFEKNSMSKEFLMIYALFNLFIMIARLCISKEKNKSTD